MQYERPLRLALSEPNGARFGREQATDEPGGFRIVVQFGLGSRLFDWFFNGRTGYRAHYYASRDVGPKFNNRVADALLSGLKERLPDAIQARAIGDCFSDLGPVQVSKEFVV